ncbi:transposase domain-containing protein [Burkholderia seminalis]|uniref:transposase domain-containing protein n=1 Tax=Burkholderia seminalis TaxID=488731 RepID=UPI0021AB3123|nr:transposase domain-containing protein [Burkholderia seminalis]
MHRVEPYRYLVWLFTRLPLAATADDYADLMPRRRPSTAQRHVSRASSKIAPPSSQPSHIRIPPVADTGCARPCAMPKCPMTVARRCPRASRCRYVADMTNTCHQ